MVAKKQGVGRVPEPMDLYLPPLQFHPGPQLIGWCSPHPGQILSPQLLSHMSVTPGNALIDTSRLCFTNLLGVSEFSQVDSSRQTLIGVGGDKNRMCSLSLSLVTNYQ